MFPEAEAAVLADAAGSFAELERLVAQRLAGLPLEVVVGWVEFCGLRLVVAPGVFVPRRRTELLAQATILLISPGFEASTSDVVVVEVCCGVAPVAAAVLAATERMTGVTVEVHAAEVDPVAAACARTNVGDRMQVHTGDLYDALPAALRGRIDVLVANAPYVPTSEIALMPPEARDHEPHRALDGGADGLDVQRRIITDAPAWLAPGGHLLIETGRSQAAGTVAACTAAGLESSVVTDDELAATAVVARRPTTTGSVGWSG